MAPLLPGPEEEPTGPDGPPVQPWADYVPPASIDPLAALSARVDSLAAHLDVLLHHLRGQLTAQRARMDTLSGGLDDAATNRRHLAEKIRFAEQADAVLSDRLSDLAAKVAELERQYARLVLSQ